MRRVTGVVPLLLGIMLITCSAAQAGKNAGGGMVVHTDDAYAWTNGVCAQFDDWVPQSCDSLSTRTDKDEYKPALIWFVAAFPDTSTPGVTVVYFGIDHNLPQYYIDRYGYCGPSGTIEVPDTGWPDDTDAGNSVAFGSPIAGDHLFPFYWVSAYGFTGAYLGTEMNPTGGYAAFVDDSNPPVQDEVTNFGIVRWFAEGSNDCSFGALDGGGEGGEQGGEEEEEANQDPGGEEEEGHWLDGDGEQQWMRDRILVRLREDLPTPPRGPVDALGLSAFDQLCRELGVVSVRRVVNINDEACARFRFSCRLVSLEFGRDTDELAAAREFEKLPEVVWTGVDYVSRMEVFGPPVNEPSEMQLPGGQDAFDLQWYLKWDGAPQSCLHPGDPEWQYACCEGCDIGVDIAWQYSRGDPRVRVAFFDEGADMQHLDLFDAYVFNPNEDHNQNETANLCPAGDPLYGDLDGDDDDPGEPGEPGNLVDDDVLLGWSIQWVKDRPYATSWCHEPTNHGTAVAGLLGAITDNGLGVASVAGGDGSNPGVHLIQFSWPFGLINVSALVATFVDAVYYEAQVYSSSIELPTFDPIPDEVDSLSESILFVGSAGNGGEIPMDNEFARLPGVMAVGGYDCETGGRWTVPVACQEPKWIGSDYGQDLSVMGPADYPYDCMIDQEPYIHMVMASTGPATTGENVCNPPVSYACDPPVANDALYCFGGTSAAAPIVASVAALIFSFDVEQGYPLGEALTPAQVRTIIEHTAEDILCDPASHLCPCTDPDPSCAAYLIGWDHYSGYGRVDAGRALTLPVAVLDPLVLPQGTYANPGDTIHLQWEAFDINTLNGDLSESSDAWLHLDYMVEQEESLQWYWIHHNLLTSATSHDWMIPETAEGFLRVRLTVVDSGGNTNQDYSERIPIGPDVLSGVIQSEPAVTIHGVVPNPASRGAQISYTLRMPADVDVQVFDVAGRHIRTLARGRQTAGPWRLDWDGRTDAGQCAASGMYFIQLRLGTQLKTERLVLVQ